MSYEKVWADNQKLNKNEISKLKKDGLTIFDDIPHYAKAGFESIPKDQYMYFKYAGLTVQKPQDKGLFMLRVKVPTGILSDEQAVTLAKIGHDYGRDVLDITTRQSIQFHWVPLEKLTEIFDRLKKVDLTTSEAEGDAPRNVVGNPLAGIDPNELFDTRPVVEEIYRFFQDNPDFSNLPRKYKISVNANIFNAGQAEINDLAFTPATKVIDGQKRLGFNVKVGGGLAAKPYLADALNVFVVPDQVIKVAEAVTTIYRDFGYRKSRARARLKYLVADWGISKFEEKVLELTGPLPAAGHDEISGWNGGFFFGAHPQKQKGLNYIGISVPVGRIHSDDFLRIAELARTYGNGELRTVSSQNLIIPNIPDQVLDELLTDNIFKKFPIHPAHFTGYAMACTGDEFCNKALTNTKDRMEEIAARLDREVDLDVPVRIYMVGCTNSCGQRQIADIGIQGLKLRAENNQLVDAYELFVGGTLIGGGHFNERLKGRIRASVISDVLKEFLIYFKNEKEKGETFFEFKNRLGTEKLQVVLDAILENFDN
ncbi:nitrite/sulfite reductase [Sporolactobacillus shoreicorticis]|uniref:Nitrite/sulfite reductase n=1 Tax=Sporolactobacillus shoreicorticis TaxID=1923877 RepID=A0ABW5RYH6_9BACL|nr:nitrite/sulfite reductase [Sporolactobacillus shoreicorticis]MCO7125181.1 nitrite/sulfite reductase [Sporolactobacillus shoreicorticis]